MRSKDLLGKAGESAAAAYLTAAGMRILDRNWRCADGEIDIVACRGRTLIVCEVKTRSSDRYGQPLEAIGRVKAARLRRLAIRWRIAHGMIFDEIRVDVLGLIRDPQGRYVIDHAQGVA